MSRLRGDRRGRSLRGDTPGVNTSVFTAEEGGAQHCQRDYLTLVVSVINDWFEDRLVRAK